MIADSELKKKLSDLYNSKKEVSIAFNSIKKFTIKINTYFEEWFNDDNIPIVSIFNLKFEDILAYKEGNVINTFIFFNSIDINSLREKNLEMLIEYDYPNFMIENTLNKLEKLQPEIINIYNVWLENKKVPSVNIENYTYTILVDDFNQTPIGAFLTLDWLVSEPKKAIQSLERGIM